MAIYLIHDDNHNYLPKSADWAWGYWTNDLTYAKQYVSKGVMLNKLEELTRLKPNYNFYYEIFELKSKGKSVSLTGINRRKKIEKIKSNNENSKKQIS